VEAESILLAVQAATGVLGAASRTATPTTAAAATATMMRLERSGSAREALSGAQMLFAASTASPPPSSSSAPPASAESASSASGVAAAAIGHAAAVGEAALGGTAPAWRFADVTRTTVAERRTSAAGDVATTASAIYFPDVVELQWRPTLSSGGVAGSIALLATDSAGRVMVISSDPVETLWHAPLRASVGPSDHTPAVARAGSEPLTGLCDLPYAQYLSGDYDEHTRDLHWQ
jgi:hypothetical protein